MSAGDDLRNRLKDAGGFAPSSAVQYTFRGERRQRLVRSELVSLFVVAILAAGAEEVEVLA